MTDAGTKNRKHRIVHVITSLAPGGAERTLQNLVNQSRQFDHIIICLQDAAHFGPSLGENMIRIVSLGLNPRDSPARALIRLWRVISRLKPDLVQTWMYHSDLLGGIAARLARVPFLLWNVRKSDLNPILAKKRTWSVARTLGPLSSFLPNKIISCSINAGQNHARDFGYEEQKFIYIPNGVEKQFFVTTSNERATRNESWENHGSLRVGFVARFHPQKGHQVLIDALNAVANESLPFEAFFIGEGNSWSNSNLTQLFNSYTAASSIHLLGVQTNLHEWYESFDVLVLPSLGGEGFPNVLAESMAAGTPCIASDVGDAARIIGDAGFVVPPGDNLAIAEILKRLAEYSSATYSDLRFKAKKRAQTEFSLEGMVDKYERTYLSLLHGGNGI